MADKYNRKSKNETDYSGLFKTLENEGKLPPQNLELEETLLGTLLLDKNAITRVADILLADDFYRHENKIIYSTIIEQFEKGKPIDVMTISNRLKEKDQINEIGGASYLATLINKAPASYNCEEYAQIVHRKRILRDLIAASYEIGRLGLNETDDVDVVLDQAEQLIFQIAKKKIEKNFVDIKTGLVDAFERIDMLQKNGGRLRGITTGFTQLDNLLGGLQKSDMIVLGARPSIGKSSLALDIARQTALNGNKVAIFSLEMSADQLVDRFIAAEANVDLWKIRTGMLSSHGELNDYALLHDALARLSEAKIYIDDTPGLTALQIRTKARRLMAEHGLDLIIIDYLQLIGSTSNFNNPVQQYTEISKAIKIIARELNVPVLALSQLSRSVEQRIPPVPKLSDLRETGCVTGDTKIFDINSGKFTTIKTLAEREKQDPIMVYTMDDNYNITKKPLIKAFYSGKKQIYELVLRSGRKIKASSNHPFKKLDDWYALDKLKVGDKIAIPRQITTNYINTIKKEELILLAHLLGDGCVLPNQPIHYTSADTENINIVNQCTKKLFDIEPRIVQQKNWFHAYLPSPYHLTHNKKHPITNWFKELNIQPVHSYDKIIPEIIFSLSNDQISLFIKHLFATDGNISISKNNISIYYASTSYILIEQLQHLMLRFGIQTQIRENKKNNYRICYHLVIQGKNNQINFLTNIGCYGKRGSIIPRALTILNNLKSNPNLDIIPREIWSYIITPAKEYAGISWRDISRSMNTAYCGSTLFKSGLSRERLSRLTYLNNHEINNLINSDIYWDEIVNINKLGNEDVYDATIQDTHNFLANDIIIHNSIEQDSDVVMLLYREDRYRKTTENTNIAEVIIAKHRNGATGSIKLYFEDKQASFRNLANTNAYNNAEPDENLDYSSFTPPDTNSEYVATVETAEENDADIEIEFSDN